MNNIIVFAVFLQTYSLPSRAAKVFFIVFGFIWFFEKKNKKRSKILFFLNFFSINLILQNKKQG